MQSACQRIPQGKVTNYRMKLIVKLLIFALPSLAQAQWYTSLNPLPTELKVVSISDGDTLTILDNGKSVTIRLANIDAPEMEQAFGQKSKQSLSDLCWDKYAEYEVQNIDRYGYTVAKVYCNGVEVNREQVARGMAWVYPKYNKDSSLPEVQKWAKADRRGLWADIEPVTPWEYRAAAWSQK